MLRGVTRLIRPKHWIKNGLIFLPLVFSGMLFEYDPVITVAWSFVVFSLVASCVYIINDLRDIEKDRKHPTKKHRPLASGVVSKKAAIAVLGVLLLASLCISFWIGLRAEAIVVLVAYLGLNIAYSFGLKNYPIVDIVILSAGFVLRVLYGAEVLDISMSSWLYMTILAGALYLSLGKRRNEIQQNGTVSRVVNKHYTISFLDKNMYVCMALLLVFYSLWATDPSREDSLLFLTIPIVVVLFMTYSLSIEKSSSSGDPVDVLTENIPLVVLAVLFGVVTTVLLYI